jgi:cystathionine beta-lyase/cystathionine gamma-synthase
MPHGILHYGLRTRAIHIGESPDPTTGAATPNIVLSTSFCTQHGTIGFSSEQIQTDAPYLYAREGNPNIRQLERKLSNLEGGEDAVVFASGMAAVTALFLSRLCPGDHLVVSDVCYVGVAELVHSTLPRLGIQVSLADLSDLHDTERAFRPNTKLVFAETPCNPILRLTDIEAIAALAHSAGAELAVDSTFASPMATLPLALGADYVVHSLTKYLSGHGDAMGGAIVGHREILSQIRQEAVVHYGSILNPFIAWLIMRGIATYPLRMQAHEAGALAVARFLEQHRSIKRVTYPGLDSHPQHALAKKQMRNFSGMLTFQTDNGSELAHQLSKNLVLFHYTVSLGHHKSLIFYIPTDEIQHSSFHLDDEHLGRYRKYAGEGIFRVSIGLEDPEDLCVDLERALASAREE